jgi:hypothetical protein
MRDRLSQILVFVACVTGCGTRDDDDPARTDAETAASVADGSAEAAAIGAWYADTSGLSGAAAIAPATPVAEARVIVTGATADAISGAVTPPACVAVTTDNATYVEATFTSCTGPGGRAAMSGTVRGELSFDTTPCGPAMCPTALRWTITSALAYGDGGTLDGTIAIVAPIDPAAARTLVATLAITSRRGDTVDATANATWTSDDGGCVALDASASAGTAAVTIDGLATCPDACPTAGTVALTAGTRTVSYAYDGTSSVTVTTGSGASFELPLLCGR